MPQQTINLGFQVPDYGNMKVSSPSESGSDTPTKTAYPSMTIPGNIGLAKSLKAGQMVTALVTFRVSEIAIRDRDDDDDDGPVDQYNGTRVELEAQSIQFDGVKIEDDAGEEDGASAFAKFRQKKAMTRNPDDSGDDGAK